MRKQNESDALSATIEALKAELPTLTRYIGYGEPPAPHPTPEEKAARERKALANTIETIYREQPHGSIDKTREQEEIWEREIAARKAEIAAGRRTEYFGGDDGTHKALAVEGARKAEADAMTRHQEIEARMTAELSARRRGGQ